MPLACGSWIVAPVAALTAMLSRAAAVESAMVKAVWNGAVIAESDATIVVEGNHYFPRGAVRDENLRASEHHTVCGWKGTASYYDVVVGDDVNRNAAWTYPDTKPAADEIQGRIAFWHGVHVE